ncbi:hypothetical protein DFJ77DRAFT_450955 [Powellomyces hirtus]|nr:hypothetical protein DFJ77DRAFT_450955 [Powellomyces hirtus]
MPGFSRILNRKLLAQRPRTPREVFNLRPGSVPTPHELKTQYFSLLKQYHPDRTLHLSPEERADCRIFYEEVRSAYAALLLDIRAVSRSGSSSTHQHRPSPHWTAESSVDPNVEPIGSIVNPAVAYIFIGFITIGLGASWYSSQAEKREVQSAWDDYMAAREREGLGEALGYSRTRPRR